MKLENKHIIFIAISILISFFSLVSFRHGDLMVITDWALTLIRCISKGNLYNYQNILLNNSFITNYHLLANLFIALLCVPIKLVNAMFGLHIGMSFYYYWIKIFILICNYFVAYDIFRCCKVFKISDELAFSAAYIYLISPLCQLYSIGMGQIDAFIILLMLEGLLSFFYGNYTRMAVVWALGFMVKPFIIFCIAPVMVFLWFKNKRSFFVSCGIIILFTGVQSILESILIENYKQGAREWNNGQFIPRVFEVSFQHVSACILLILLIGFSCYYLISRARCHKYYFVLFPSMLLCAFEIFVYQHPQWYLYSFVFLLIMGITFSRNYEFVGCLWLLYLGFNLYGNGVWDNGDIISGLCLKGPFGKYAADYKPLNAILNNSLQYPTEIGATILAVILIIMNLIFLEEQITKRSANQPKPPFTPEAMMLIMTPPTLLYSAVLLYLMLK